MNADTRLLYRLCVGEAAAWEEFARMEPTRAEHIVLLSRVNKVTLLLTPPRPLELGAAATALSAASARARAKLDSAAASIPVLRRICATGAWDWVLFKTCWSFPKEVSDVDILLPPGTSLSDVASAVAAAGGRVAEQERYKLKVYVPTPAGDGVLDFHTKITQDDFDFFDETGVFAAKREAMLGDEPVQAVSLPHDLQALVLEAFFGDSVMTLASIIEIDRLAADPAVTAAARVGAESRGWAEPFDAVILATRLAIARLREVPDGTAATATPTSLRPRIASSIDRRFGRGTYPLPRFFPLVVVSAAIAQKAEGDRKRAGGRRGEWWARATQAARRQAGARLYGIPLKVDGVVARLG